MYMLDSIVYEGSGLLSSPKATKIPGRALPQISTSFPHCTVIFSASVMMHLYETTLFDFLYMKISNHFEVNNII
jgi:hypothetical protein